jgi:hypothetical protein
VRCNAPDSFAGQALRTGSALLIEAGVQQSAGGIVASEQVALIADTQSSVGELMDRHWAAYEMDPLAGRGQLENEVFEGDGVVVTDDPLMLARQHQLQFDAGQLDEGTFRLGRLATFCSAQYHCH